MKRDDEHDMSSEDYLWDGSGQGDDLLRELEGALAPLRYRGALPDAERNDAERNDSGLGDGGEGEGSDRDRTGHLRVVEAAPASLSLGSGSGWRPWFMAAAVLALVVGWGLFRPDATPAVALHTGLSAPSRAAANAAARPARRPAQGWLVEVTGGAPSCDGSPLANGSRLAVGSWMHTDGSASARLTVADIGFLEVAPNSRLRILSSHATQHRVEVSSGWIYVSLDAPAERFVIETALGTVVDLGCRYTMSLLNGRLRVEVSSGAVAIDRGGVDRGSGAKAQRVYLPAGVSCTADARALGVPRYDHAPAVFRDALARYDAGEEDALAAVLRHAEVGDALSLWHLYNRSGGIEQRAVAQRLINLGAPLPNGVNAAKLYAGKVPAAAWWPMLYSPNDAPPKPAPGPAPVVPSPAPAMVPSAAPSAAKVWAP